MKNRKMIALKKWLILLLSEIAYFVAFIFFFKATINAENVITLLIIFCFATSVASFLLGVLAKKWFQDEAYLFIVSYGLISAGFFYFIFNNMMDINSEWYSGLLGFLGGFCWIICVFLFSILNLASKGKEAKNLIEIPWGEE